MFSIIYENVQQCDLLGAIACHREYGRLLMRAAAHFYPTKGGRTHGKQLTSYNVCPFYCDLL
jgi:hypothetical protein